MLIFGAACSREPAPTPPVPTRVSASTVSSIDAGSAPRETAPANPVSSSRPLSASDHRMLFYDAAGRRTCPPPIGHGDGLLGLEAVNLDPINGCGSCLTVESCTEFDSPTEAWSFLMARVRHGCRACIEIAGPKGTEIAEVTDQCSIRCGGRNRSMSLTRHVFREIVGNASDRRNVTWKAVPCKY
jgi:hypothetical protein